MSSMFEGDGLDASLLLMAEVGLIDSCDARFRSSVARIEQELCGGDHLFRRPIETVNTDTESWPHPICMHGERTWRRAATSHPHPIDTQQVKTSPMTPKRTRTP